MEYQENRLQTFKAKKWPHNSKKFKSSPESFAKAGFYYTPSAPGSDDVTCFLCHKSLDGWDASDDAFEEHFSHATYCSWAIIQCAPQHLKEAGEDAEQDLIPTSQYLEDARIATYGKWWPHSKGFYGTVKKMSKAGFHYNPMIDSDDNVSCIYCGMSLDGWEPKDVPFDEHFRRNPKCKFFTLKLKEDAEPTPTESTQVEEKRKSDVDETKAKKDVKRRKTKSTIVKDVKAKATVKEPKTRTDVQESTSKTEVHDPKLLAEEPVERNTVKPVAETSTEPVAEPAAELLSELISETTQAIEETEVEIEELVEITEHVAEPAEEPPTEPSRSVDITVEQYIKQEIAKQVEQLRSAGDEMAAEFQAKAAAAKQAIQAM